MLDTRTVEAKKEDQFNFVKLQEKSLGEWNNFVDQLVFRSLEYQQIYLPIDHYCPIKAICF